MKPEEIIKEIENCSEEDISTILLTSGKVLIDRFEKSGQLKDNSFELEMKFEEVQVIKLNLEYNPDWETQLMDLIKIKKQSKK